MPPPTPPLYPLTFRPLLYEKVWGGRGLENLGKVLPKAATKYGESWELADMPATSASGAGGGAARSVINAGPLSGRTLNEAMKLWGEQLLGLAKPTPSGDFPLLVKFIDAADNLSVQTHPTAEYAQRYPDAHVKTECWFILDCEPGAMIYKGVKSGVSREQFAAHIADETVANDLIETAAVPGTCHTLPSGTVHALGAGVLVAEVMTPSDTTFRVFDWGRSGRQLHIAESMACIDFGPAPRGSRITDGEAVKRVCETDFFTIDCHQPLAGQILTVGDGRACVVLIGLAGQGRLELELGSIAAPFDTLDIQVGSTVLVPAAIARDCRVSAGDGLRMLRVTLK
ncbi:MAG: type I phosphomannose isomerase catalytic subunit [Phycisphaerales bacterium]